MMSSKPLGAPISSNGPAAFTGRYSPTYRSPDPMRRCMSNAPVSVSRYFSDYFLSFLLYSLDTYVYLFFFFSMK